MGTRSDYAYGNSTYMKADEIAGRVIRAKISTVEDVEFEKGIKPVLGFEGRDKQLVVNATNFDALSEGLGPNTNNWPGHTILLRGEKITFQGKRVNAIRVSVPAPAAKPAPDYEVPDEIEAS